MNATIERINESGSAFVEFALPMLIQSGLLILILLSVDLLVRKKVRAVFRYWMWMLVLAKLLLPTSLSSPVSVGRWFGNELAYLDVVPAPAAAPKVNVAPTPAAEAPPVTDTLRVETTTRAPAAVVVEPTARPFEPAVAKPISPLGPPSPTATPLSWRGVALLSWLAVAMAMVLLLLQRAFFVRRIVAQAQKANRPMTEVLAHCCDRMAVKQRIDLKISASATSPAVCGLFNPAILVPENLARAFSSGELRVVLLHELAHIKRGDLWVNLAQTFLQIFYFYNPLLWLANAVIRRVREQAVDEMVLVAMGDNAPQYPQTLLSVAKIAFKRPALSLRLTGVVESRSALTGRIKHILNRPMPKTAKLGIIGLAVVFAAAAVLLPMAAFLPGPPELVVKGTVRDAQTGEPIAGARVFDDGYGPTPAWGQIRAGERSEWGAIADAAGEYSFLTWPEHHSVSAEAPGYRPERESLYENHFTVNDSDGQTMNFVLEPVTAKGPAGGGIGTDSIGAESVIVPILGYDVKLNFADPTVRDGSFHSYQSVSFSMSFDKIEDLKTDTLFGRLLIGQTALPVLLKDDLVTVQDGVSGQEIHSETWPADEPQFEKVVKLAFKYGQKECSCPVRVELMRQQGGNPIGSYWFCAYLSGRLPWGVGGRIFEIVNLDQQMEFRAVGDGTDRRDAVLGIDINGDGKIDHSETGGEQFDLYEPFQIGSKIYRVTEVDPYMPRVVFHEIGSDKASNGISVRLGGSEPLGLFYSNNALWFEVQNRSAETIEFNQEPYAQKGTNQAQSDYLEIIDVNGSAVEYEWRAKKSLWSVKPGRRYRAHSFLNGRPLRRSGPGTYKARITLVARGLESGKTFEVKSNWHPFEVTPCGYRPDFVPKTAFEQLRLADAYHAMIGSGHATVQDVIGQYEAIIEQYPNRKYELEGHFGIAKAASENRDPSSVTADDYALSRRHYQAIIRQWPDVVTYHTIHARYQAYFQTAEFKQSRYDLCNWLKSLTREQKIDSMRNYFVWPSEPSEEDIQRALSGLDKAIAVHISSLERDYVQAGGSDHLFTVYGTVTGDSGRPIEGVQMTADCGHGKLERTGRAVTDQNGRYTLGLTSSIKHPGADPYDVGIQTARIEARLKGYYEANICRDGNLAMAGKAPRPDEERFVADYAGVVLPHKPYELNFVMRPAAQIEGELVDEQGSPMPRLMLWLQGDGLYLSNRADIYGRSDRNGRFIIEDIPCRSVWFNCPGPKLARSGTVDLAMPGTYRIKLQYVESASGEPSLTIAELRGPASVWPEMSQSDLSGRIADSAGRPVAGAQVALCTDKIGAKMSHGKLEPMRSEVGSSIVRTDGEGRFTLGQRPADSFILIVADDSGFAFVRSEEFPHSNEIRLQPWGRIEGQVAKDRNAGGNQIWMSGLPNSSWLLRKREYSYETECDAEGRFVFEKVPAGWFEAGYLIRTGDSGWSITSRTPVEVEAGETAEITLGGSGRPVVGKFVPPQGYDKPIYFGNGLRSLVTIRPERPRPDNYDQMTKRQQQQWYRQWRMTDGYREYRDTYSRDPNWRQYTFRINDDGSFRIEDVIAGKYDFTVWIEERHVGGGRPEEIGGFYGSIEVPEMAGGRSDEPLDLGELELSMREPVRVGDAAPLFEARTLDGRDLKLIDYRGKFVLLSFWQPVFHPELERLKILAAGYNAVGRLEIIGLGGNDTLEEVKRYVEENDIPWPQIFTGQDFRSGIAKDYRIPGVPWIFLIGPGGRIVANGLRGEKLNSTVLEALDSTEPHKTEAPPSSRNKVTDIRLPFTFTIYTLTPDDKPQPGVKVRCLHPRPERAEPIVDMAVESDEDGVAEFRITQADLLTDWMYWFSLADEDFVGAPGVGITPDEGDWTFRVLPAEKFELNVVGDKKPVSGATVHLQIDHGEGKDWDPKRFWAYEKVLTDSSGQARAKFVKGRISMAVAAKGYASRMISNVELPTEKPYEIKLTKGRDITGRVVDPNDKPLASVTVTARSKGAFPWEEEFLLKGSTDRKGNFTLRNASAGKWEITACSEDPNKPYFIAPITVNVRSWWRAKPVKMVAEEGFRLKGRYVTDYKLNLRHDGGLPWIDVGVTKPSPSWMQLKTNNDGTFDIWGLPCRGQGSVRFVGVGGYHNFVEVPKKYDCFEIFGDRLNFRNIPPATYENIKVHYLLAGMVKGTVVDAAAVSFPGAEITVEPEGTRHRTDEEGKFSIRVAPGDTLTLTVRDTQTGAIVFTSEPFSVEEGEVIEKNITTRYERRN